MRDAGSRSSGEVTSLDGAVRRTARIEAGIADYVCPLLDAVVPAVLDFRSIPRRRIHAGIAVARSGTQVALREALDGRDVNRPEHVTDAQHGGR